MKKNCREISPLQRIWGSKKVTRMALFFIMICISQGFAKDSYAQITKLSLNIEDQPIQEILEVIEEQTEFRFMYDATVVDVHQRKSIKCKNQSVVKILDDLFKDSGISYKIDNRQIALTSREEKSIAKQQVTQQQRKVSGKVTDPQGEPLPGAAVMVKGTTIGTVTDSEGNYSLSNVPPDATLVFSFVGMETQEINVSNRTRIDVTMQEEAVALEEVIAIGYGTLLKKDLTSSITTINAENFNKSVSGNPILRLSGKVPGLNITTDGDPNGPAAVILRGPSTLRSGAQTPLYVVDGIPNGIMPPPEDIVSIDVLKDASAAAIYGSMAANGVILVTTKKGERGKFKLSYNGYAAVETISKGYDMLKPHEYRQWISDMGLSLDPVDDDGSNTVWIDEITRPAISYNHNLSFSGGNDKTTYIASINYRDNEGIVINTGNSNLTLHTDIDQKMFNDKLKIGINIYNSIFDSYNVIYGGVLFNTVWKYLPTVGIYNPDGSFRENYGAATYNPYALVKQNIADGRSKSFIGTGYVQLNILKGWDYFLNASYRNGQSNSNAYQYRGSRLSLSSNGLAVRNTYESEQKLMETFTSYEKKIKQHRLKLLVGYSWKENVSGNGFQTSSCNFISDETLYFNLGLGNNYQGFRPDYGSINMTTLRMISGYSRLNYDYKDKYLLQATIRRDGSSAFGVNNRWGTFPSVSAGWRVTEESFMQNQHLFDNLKLRVGYGVSGNSLGFDPLISKLRFGQSGISYYKGEYINGIIPTQNENPDLKWETTRMLNIGMDFSILKSRVSGTLEYYKKNTDDLLWTYNVSATQYYVDKFTANVGSMENKGLELTLAFVPVQNKNFSWQSNLVLSHNKNKLISLSSDRFPLDYVYIGSVGNHGQSGMNSQILQEGYPVGTFYTWVWKGFNEKGQSQFLSADGVTLTTAPTTSDRHYAGNAQPKLTGGWYNILRYKNFTLDFLLRGVTGNKIMNVTLSNLNYPGEATHYNQHRMVLECNAIDLGAPYTSTRYLEKGDYLRLDNITLGYDFKINNPVINSVGIYTTVNNAFVITKYKGCDPEVNLGGITPGIDDDNYYPKTRSVIFGMNIDF